MLRGLSHSLLVVEEGPRACRPVGGRFSLSSRFVGGESASSLVVPTFGGLHLHR